MSVLVTGAAGFIGSHVAEALLRGGTGVVSLDNRDPFYEVAAKDRNLAALHAFEGFSDLDGDIRDPASWEAVPADVEAVIHLAARAGVRPSIAQPALYADVNVTGTARMLEFTRARGIRRVVFASSSSVYGESPVPFTEADVVDSPQSPYAATKRAGELLCHTEHELHGTSVVVARLFTVHGPRQRPDLAIHRFARLLLEGRPLPRFGDGSSARDYTYVDDVVRGILAALELTTSSAPVFEIVNLGSDHPVTLNEVIHILAEELGVEPEVEEHPVPPGDVSRTWADLTRARALLGYEPRVAFRDGVRAFLRWLGDEGSASVS